MLARFLRCQVINEVAAGYQIPTFTVFGEWAVQKAWENIGKRAAQARAAKAQKSATAVSEEDPERKEAASQEQNSLSGETEAIVNEPL